MFEKLEIQTRTDVLGQIVDPKLPRERNFVSDIWMESPDRKTVDFHKPVQ